MNTACWAASKPTATTSWALADGRKSICGLGTCGSRLQKCGSCTHFFRKSRNGSPRRTSTVMPIAWSRLTKWWSTITLKMGLMNGWIIRRWRRRNRRRSNMWPARWRARTALPTTALLSMTYMSANGCAFTGISPMNGPSNRPRRPLPPSSRKRTGLPGRKRMNQPPMKDWWGKKLPWTATVLWWSASATCPMT